MKESLVTQIYWSPINRKTHRTAVPFDEQTKVYLVKLLSTRYTNIGIDCPQNETAVLKI